MMTEYSSLKAVVCYTNICFNNWTCIRDPQQVKNSQVTVRQQNRFHKIGRRTEFISCEKVLEISTNTSTKWDYGHF